MGSIFGDPIIATVIIDRLLHRSTTVNIRGESSPPRGAAQGGVASLLEQRQPDAPARALNGHDRQRQSL